MKEFKRFTDVQIVSNCAINDFTSSKVVFGRYPNSRDLLEYHMRRTLPEITPMHYWWFGVTFDIANSKINFGFSIGGFTEDDSAWDLFLENCEQANLQIIRGFITNYGLHLFQIEGGGYYLNLDSEGCYSWLYISNL